MKHLFIINPNAGNSDPSPKLIAQIHSAFEQSSDEYEIHLTTGPGDATEYTASCCEATAEPLRFYACGGDGTLNEVVNGAYCYPHATVSIVPCGSGNDFIKALPPFTSLADLIHHGQECTIDLLSVNDRMCVNLTCLGFDADVNYSATKYKKLPFVKGAWAYNLAIIERFFCRMGHRLSVLIDDKEQIEGTFLLNVFANGQYYGGQYRGAPLARVDDGLLDVGLVRTIPRPRILQLIGYYARGEHVESPLFRDIVIYRKAKTVRVKAQYPMVLNVDGELCHHSDIEFAIIPGALRLFCPPGIAPAVGHPKLLAAAGT